MMVRGIVLQAKQSTEWAHEIQIRRRNQASITIGLPKWLSGKEYDYNVGDAGDRGSIPGLVRCPRGGDGNPL